MEHRKMVGVIISDVSASYQRKFMEGFLTELFRWNVDAVVFSPIAKNGMIQEFLEGENNIYSLINYDLIDGIVILPDTLSIRDQKCTDFLDKLYNEFKKPIICVDYFDERFEIEITRDTKGVEELTDHLIDVHNCKNIHFISGPKTHYHSQMRIEGFKRSLEKHKLKFDEGKIFYGDFLFTSGQSAFDSFAELDEFPDAVISANEGMGQGFIYRLEKEGYRIPDDIAVVGFDSEGDETINNHVLTSGIRDVYSTGVRSAQRICRHIIDSTIQIQNNDNTKMIILQTCGCKETDEYINQYRSKSVELDNCENIYSDYNFMQENLISVCDIKDFMWLLNWYTIVLEEFDRCSICINDKLIDGCCDEETEASSYTDNILLIYDRDMSCNAVTIDSDRQFKKTEMYPLLHEERDKPAVFYFTPFHFYRRCFGYMVIEYIGSPAVNKKIYSRWMRYVNTAFESLRRQLNYKIKNNDVIALYEQNSELNEDMIKTQEELILSFAEITESKSGQTGKHVKRVSEYSKVLGEALGLSPEETETLRMASMMHDIGKLSIPPNVLEKPGKLTPDEFEMIKTHVTEGERLLHNSPGRVMNQARTIALEHHERWNGNGYLGKKGDEIDFTSRIVAVADVYDALVSKRSYKKALDEKIAYNIIINESGEHFDPKIVEAFVNNYDKILNVLRSHPDEK